MTAIQHLLQRWGFVQLRRYGLELTSDGRILSARPAVLDDGTGGRIVGWQDGDVSIWKLSRWSEAPRVGSEVASGATGGVTRGVIVMPPAPAPAVRPAIPASSEARATAVPPPSRPSARVIPADVAGEPTVDEDDWEWTIALARARVAVEEAEVARPPAVAPRPGSPALRPPERPTLRSSATADLAASGDWREADAADTVEASAYADYRVSTRPLPRIVPEPALARTLPGTASPSTVIPVPALPTVDATRRSRLEPVVRTAPSSTLVSRFAKGTGPVDPPTLSRTRPAAVTRTRPAAVLGTSPAAVPGTRSAAVPGTRSAAVPGTRSAAVPGTRSTAVIVEDTQRSLSVGDHTTPGVAPATRRTMAAPASELDDNLGEPVAPPAPSSGDRTQPGIALPVAARTVALPSIKHRAAR
jgi:hypothetical protein